MPGHRPSGSARYNIDCQRSVEELAIPFSVVLGTPFEAFVKTQVASGRDNTTSEVVRNGLRLLQDPEDLRLARLGWLRNELLKGLASGAATPLNLAEVKAGGQRLRACPLGAACALR